MTRTVSILAIAFGTTATIIAIIGWLAPLAGESLMNFVRQDPDGPFWVRLLTPILPGFSLIAFGLVAAARRRKLARAATDAPAHEPVHRIGA